MSQKWNFLGMSVLKSEKVDPWRRIFTKNDLIAFGGAAETPSFVLLQCWCWTHMPVTALEMFVNMWLANIKRNQFSCQLAWHRCFDRATFHRISPSKIARRESGRIGWRKVSENIRDLETGSLPVTSRLQNGWANAGKIFVEKLYRSLLHTVA